MDFLRGTGRVYERDIVGVVGVIGGLIGDTRRSVESPSEASESWRDSSVSVTAGGEPGTVSNLILDHTEWEKSSPGEARRRIGGRFLEKGESKPSWGPWVSSVEWK